MYFLIYQAITKNILICDFRKITRLLVKSFSYEPVIKSLYYNQNAKIRIQWKCEKSYAAECFKHSKRVDTSPGKLLFVIYLTKDQFESFSGNYRFGGIELAE